MSELPKGAALVVGINAYDGRIAPLRSAVADASAIAEVLREQHGYTVTALLDEQASAQAITSQLESFAAHLTDGERPFLFYFAGHGVARGDGAEGPQGFLLPQDARPGDTDSWVSMVTVRAALEAMSSRHLLVVLDCCFAGAFRWAATRDVAWDAEPLYASQYQRFLKGQAWQALTSASHEEKALDVTPGRDNTRDDALAGRHSPFAAALLRGLAGEADTSRANAAADGVITATELFQFAYDTLVPDGAQSHQTPGLWPLRNDNTGQFIFQNPVVPLNTREDPPLTDDANPWLGLRTYTRNDKALFFGRERVIAELVERVACASRPFLAVVGASGTGKSSVVRAGLIPHLTDSTQQASPWQLVSMPRLAADPVSQLAETLSAIAEPTARSILLIDQFEELYTQCHNDDRRQEFLSRLRALIDQPNAPFVIITLRTDFEPRPRAAQALHDIWDDARYVVPAFTMAEMREVIVGPANAMALFFEPDDLVETLLQEVMAMPGALPLLSFGLAEMYRCAQQRRQSSGDTDRALTQDDYDTAGGVVGALHRRANRVYAAAGTDSERRAIRTLFLRMVSTEAGLTRRRVHRSELVFADQHGADVQRMIETFTEARLLVSDGDFIEPAHDTLVVAWERLQDWLAASHSQSLIRAAWRAASDWKRQSQSASADPYLWHDDPRLPQLLEQQAQLNQTEREFAAASVALKERNQRRRRMVFAGVAVALVAAAIISIFQAQVAKREARRAQEQTRIAQEQYERARHANGQTLMEQAQQFLDDRRYFDAALTSARVLGFQGYGASQVQPDEQDADNEPLFDLFDNEYGNLIGILSRANATPFRPVAYRPLQPARLASEKSLLAGISGSGDMELWDLKTGRFNSLKLPPLSEYAEDIDLALSADGSALALRNGATLLIWRLDQTDARNKPQQLVVPLRKGLFGLAFDASASRLAIGSASGIAVWSKDTATGLFDAAPSMVRTSSFTPSALTFRPRSHHLLVGGQKKALGDANGPLLLIDMTDGCAAPDTQLDEGDNCTTFVGPRSDMLIVEEAGRYQGRLDFARAIAFDNTGTALALGSLNRVFAASRGDTVFSYDDVPARMTTLGRVTALAYSPDGRTLAVGSSTLLELLDLSTGTVVARTEPGINDADTTLRLSFSSDGKLLLYAGFAHMTLYDTSFLAVPKTSPGNAADGTLLNVLQDSLDAGERVVRDYWARRATNRDNLRTARLFDVAEFEGELTAEVVREDQRLWLDFGRGSKEAVAAQPAPGKLLAIGANSRGYVGDTASIYVYNRDTATLVMRFSTSHDVITKLAFDSNSNQLLAFARFNDAKEHTLYRWSLQQPDLFSLFTNDPICMAPLNVPVGSLLEGQAILECRDQT